MDQKKADVDEHLLVLIHVGLLFGGPPVMGCPSSSHPRLYCRSSVGALDLQSRTANHVDYSAHILQINCQPWNYGIAMLIVFGSDRLSKNTSSIVQWNDITHMRTQGEIEAAVCAGMSRFEEEYMGRGPKSIRAHLIGDLLVVRLEGVLTAAEQHLVKSLPAEKGRDLLKQVRSHLIETARPIMEAMIQEATEAKVLSLHHDISTVTGEEIVLFTLANAPGFRDKKKK